ncbi:MAG TPA: ion channel [Acidimicrobiia bacterium]|nr:ion channel [Acidimicrobiia bacterium]
MTITVIADEGREHRRMPDDAGSSGGLHIDRQSYAERFARGDSYGLLLALLIALYLLIAAEQHSNLWGRFVISVVLGLVLLLAFHTSHVRSHAFRIGIVLVVLADVANFVQAATGREGGDGSTFIMFALVLLAPVAIVHRILSHETVGLETILGSICVYVLIAIAFAGIYGGVNETEPAGFFAQKIVPNNVDFLYFSFVTITTVGYGDLTASTSTGRVLVTFEAVIGQIFLVTLVARLVSLYGNRQRPARDGPTELGDPSSN